MALDRLNRLKRTEHVSTFDFESRGIKDRDVDALMACEISIAKSEVKLKEVAIEMGKSLVEAREVFYKYGGEQTFGEWYRNLGLNKDQVSLFSGRYRLSLEYPQAKETIKRLSDVAIKETINKKTPQEVVIKVLAGELKTGKAIKESRSNFQKTTSRVLEVDRELEAFQVEVLDSEIDIQEALERELSLIRKDVRERRRNLKKLEAEMRAKEEKLEKLLGITAKEIDNEALKAEEIEVIAKG